MILCENFDTYLKLYFLSPITFSTFCNSQKKQRQPHLIDTQPIVIKNVKNSRYPFPCLKVYAKSLQLIRLCATHRRQLTRLPRPWDSPGKNTGVGCHFLLQCTKGKSESEVNELSPTLSDPMDCSPPGSSTHGIFQARVLEWGAIAFSVKVYEAR